MNAEVKEWISTCEPCRQHEVSHVKEILMSHDIPDRPGQKVAADLFTVKGRLLQQLLGFRQTRQHQCSNSHQEAESPLCTMTVIVNWLVTMDHSLLQMNSRSLPRVGTLSTWLPPHTRAKEMERVKTTKKLLRKTMKLEKTNTCVCYHIGTHIQKG